MRKTKHWNELATMLNIDTTITIVAEKQKKTEVMDFDEIPETNHRVNGVGKKDKKKKKKNKFAGSTKLKKQNWERMQALEWDPTSHIDADVTKIGSSNLYQKLPGANRKKTQKDIEKVKIHKEKAVKRKQSRKRRRKQNQRPRNAKENQ